MKRLILLAALTVTAALLAVGCGSPAPVAVAPTAAVVIQTAPPVVVQQTVIVQGTSQVVEKVVTPTPAPTKAAQARDTIVVGSFQEPRTFCGICSGGSQAIATEMRELYQDPLYFSRGYDYQPNPNFIDGGFPTLENGGAKIADVTVKKGDLYFDAKDTFQVITATADIQVKQVTVTGKIKAGLKWSDGEALTTDDMLFNHELVCNPDFPAADTSTCKPNAATGDGFLIDVKTPSPTTIVVTYTAGVLDPTYFLTPFFRPYPRHTLGKVAVKDLAKDDRLNRNQLGWGPYVFKEWVAKDHATFTANPNWAGGKPKTPTIIYKFITDTNQLLSQLLIGDVDKGSGTTGVGLDQYLALQDADKKGVVKLVVDKTAPTWEHIDLNLNDPNDKTLKAPHPVLGDLKVRQAIAYALNRPDYVKQILFGQADLVDEPFQKQQWAYTADVTKYEYSVDKAKALLDQAGWVLNDKTKIREKGGKPMSLTLVSTTGSNLRAQSTQRIQQDLKAIGIDVKVNLQPSGTAFGVILTERTYDLFEFAWVSSSDPGSYTLYACSQIATPDNKFSGQNDMGWCNDAASKAVTAANYGTLSRDERKKFYDVLNKEFTKDLPSIPLFNRPNVYAWNSALQGVQVDPTEYDTWSAPNWVVTQ